MEIHEIILIIITQPMIQLNINKMHQDKITLIQIKIIRTIIHMIMENHHIKMMTIDTIIQW